MPPRPPRILLLQARLPDDPVRREEVESFAERADLPVSAFEPWDLLAGPPSLAHARRCDALMVGGSGDFSVSRGDLPALDRLLDFLAEWSEAGVPTFASCFGFQCLVAALGGEVVHDPDATEVGTFDLNLTEAGRRDELFGELPQRFAAQLGRKDRAARLPDGVPNLVRSERCPFQALRLPGRPVWATQFHPELDRAANLARFERYGAGYGGRFRAPELRESPQASRLLRLFVARVVRGLAREQVTA